MHLHGHGMIPPTERWVDLDNVLHRPARKATMAASGRQEFVHKSVPYHNPSS